MPTLCTAGNAVEVAEQIAHKLPQTLPDSAKALYAVLVAAAIETAQRRGHSPRISHVTLHCPLEQVAAAVGMSRQTVWRHLPSLKALGLVDHKPHKGTLFGETRNTGTLWQVRLNPVRGSRARLTSNDLRHKWRDLEADYRRYKLSSLTLKKQTVTYTKDSPNTALILAWSAPLNPVTNRAPVKTVSCRALESVLDVTTAPRDDRNRMVSLAAEALCQALGDAGSVSWYQKLLWQLLRRFDATGEDHSYSLYMMATRARTDYTERFSRRGGAVLVSRLKTAPWYDEVMRGPPVRVGVRPLKA